MLSHQLIFALRDVDRSMTAIAGGKGANLGELVRIDGIRVPDGICVSTQVYQRMVHAAPLVQQLLSELSPLTLQDIDAIRDTSARLRSAIAAISIPTDIADDIATHIDRLGADCAYAVRSSATAEDLHSASFAGQQDTYLNVVGTDAILRHITQCWASLFTERAIMYRIQNHFDHTTVALAVLIQRMVLPEAAGVMFTADPVSGNRKIISIDAIFGLGDSLVSGMVNVDNYRVQSQSIVEKKVAAKKMGIYPVDDGGTVERELPSEQQNVQVLDDEQIKRLAQLGSKIESHFGQPQDIEWCLQDNVFHIVQSRPITTLFPIPGTPDERYHVYLSVGHQQMMTDAMKPLGLSFFLLTTSGTMQMAGGRLFVDITDKLADPVSQQAILGNSDPLTKDALLTVLDRPEFSSSTGKINASPGSQSNKVISASGYRGKVENNPAIVTELIRSMETSLQELKKNIGDKSGPELFDFIRGDVQQAKSVLFNPQSLSVILAAMDASTWVNEKMNEWLGVTNAADALSQSVPNNITSEMGLALLDVADVIRPYPHIIDFLQTTEDDNFTEALSRLTGGREVLDAIENFLLRYGMRCTGEIDITRTRWSERPAVLIPMILNNIRNFKAGESRRKFEEGKQEAIEKEQDLVNKLMQLPDGQLYVDETRRMISLMRNYIGYREYPKYGIVSRYFVYKTALMKEAERLVRPGVLHDAQDIYYLTFDELSDAARTQRLDYTIIARRIDDYKHFAKLSPPRVITSDGEVIFGKYRHGNLPANAIAGLAVSAGVVEGRARIVLNMAEASLEPGDILVTSFTDPSWTPLFVSIKGLVTEVGGLMTHGAVIAREYGLPAVVGVENATRLIRDGDWIRVHGSDGFVEIL
jgi:pyruvate,water dikinase